MHMRKPHVKIPVGFLATCVSRVKGICMKIPEVNVYDKSYDNDLETLLNFKYLARGEDFRIRKLENNLEELKDARDLDYESTKAVRKLLDKQIYSLPESCQSAILNMLPSSGAENESKTNHAYGSYYSTSSSLDRQNFQKCAKVFAKREKLKNRKKSKDPFGGLATGFPNDYRQHKTEGYTRSNNNEYVHSAVAKNHDKNSYDDTKMNKEKKIKKKVKKRYAYADCGISNGELKKKNVPLLKKCKGCQGKYYCCKNHQKKDWNTNHRDSGCKKCSGCAYADCGISNGELKKKNIPLLKKCTGCQGKYYCCKNHQKKDWNTNHRDSGCKKCSGCEYANCGISNRELKKKNRGRLKKCEGCERKYYCCKNHQKKDWNTNHRDSGCKKCSG
eukprot:705501_1